MIVQKIILTKPNTIIDGMNRTPGSSGVLILQQDSVGGRNFTIKANGNIGEFVIENKDPNTLTLLQWIKDDTYCYWFLKGTLGGSTTPPEFVTVYFGWADNMNTPTQLDIESLESLDIIDGSEYQVDFSENTQPKYLCFAEPLTQPIKTDFEDISNPLNKGQIGGGANLFRSPVEVGPYRYYVTNYETVAVAPYKFKKGGEVIPPDPIIITPDPPTLTADDNANTLEATHPTLQSEIVYSTNGGAYVAYTGIINVGDVDRAAGYYKFKIKAAPGRNESSVVNSPAFNKTPVVVTQYTLTVGVTGTTGAVIYVNGSPIVGNTLTVDEGTVLNNIVAVKPGFTMAPTSVPSVVMDQDRSLSFTATPIPVYRTLTIAVNGLSEPYEVYIDGILQPSNVLTFVDGTVLNDITIQVENYIITPPTVASVVMNQNRVLNFTATLMKRLLTIDTGAVTGVDVYVDDVLQIGVLEYDHGTELINVSVHKAGYTFAPVVVPSTIMDMDRTLVFIPTVVNIYTLTIDVQGTTGYDLEIDGAIKTGTTFQYNEGTVISEVKVTKLGWRFTPVKYTGEVMDADKTLSFTAEEIPIYTLDFNVVGTTGYQVRIDGVLQPSGQLSFPEGTVLVDIMLSKIGWKFNPLKVNTLTMDSNKTLDFTATEDFTQLNYLPGFTAYNPKERYARLGQGGQSSIMEVEPGKWQASVHRIDFIGYIRVPIGGEVAQKVSNLLETNIVYLNSILPWSDDANKEDYNITGYSAGATGKNSFYGDGIDNKLEIRDWTNNGFYSPIPIPDGNWVIFRRETWDLMNIYYSDGSNEQLIYSMDIDNELPVDFMYLKHTIWKDGSNDGWLNYPQVRGCFHELDDTWPPSIVYDDDANLITASHETLPITEILYNEGDGPWLQYTGPINVGNIVRPFGYYKFKVKAATGRDESPWVQSAAFTVSTIPEGKQNLVFQGLENLVYDSASNTYSIEDTTGSNNGGSGYNSQIILPINGSAAIYWTQDTINESRLNLGFDIEPTPRGGNLDIASQLNKWFNNAIVAVLRSDGIDVNVGDMTSDTEYRLVCRNNGPDRTWKIEASTDDWVSGAMLYTYTEALNAVTLYPKMLLQSWNVTTITGLKVEYYATQNIPELVVVTPDPPTLTADNTLNTLSADHELGISEILMSINDAAYVQYTGTIDVGNVDRAAGYYKFKVKAAMGRNESSVVNSPAFTTTPTNTLTFIVNGPTSYKITIGGLEIAGNTYEAEENSTLNNIVVSKAGWEFDPPLVATITMDTDKTLTFDGTEVFYMTGYTAINDFVADFPGTVIESTPGEWERVDGTKDPRIRSLKRFAVGSFIAFKCKENAESNLGVYNTTEGVAIVYISETDGTIGYDLPPYPSYMPLGDVMGGWVVFERVSLTNTKISYTPDGVTMQELDSITTTNEADFEIQSHISGLNKFLHYPQGKNLI